MSHRRELTPSVGRVRLHPLVDVTGITLLRFGLMVATLQVAAAGVGGWDLGLVTNIAVTILAIGLLLNERTSPLPRSCPIRRAGPSTRITGFRPDE